MSKEFFLNININIIMLSSINKCLICLKYRLKLELDLKLIDSNHSLLKLNGS